MSRKYLRRDRSRSLTKSETEEQEIARLVESPEPQVRSVKIMSAFPDDNGPHCRPGEFGNHGPDVVIHRPVISQATVSPKFFNRAWNSKQGQQSSKCKLHPKDILLRTVPILSWLPHYEWKSIGFDAISGFMVAVMNIPQGMAYAMLGNLPAIVGIYMAFFPVIIYSILGTSRHISMGTFAVVCLMCGKTALDLQTSYSSEGKNYSVLEISTAISLAVGVIQVGMGILRMGALSRLLNHELVSGFTTGAAVHVFTSQVRSLLGLTVPKRSGLFKIIMAYIDFGKHIGESNIAAVVISVITIGILTTYNELLKPIWAKRIRFPLPLELITIIAGTLFSLYLNFEAIYKVTIVSTIPTGFPAPLVPNFDIFTKAIFPDGFIIAFVAYAISISMAKIFAAKHNYTVDANQELIAQGASNTVGSFFSCAPIAASLSRSLIQEQVGGRTQMASLFSCFILTFVLLWIGPFFETLPTCVLSSIIVVALKGMFLQVFDLPKSWAESKINGMIWIITFVSTVVLDIEYGLGIGALLSTLVLIWRGNQPKMTVLGVFADTDVYADLNSSDQVQEIPTMKIIKYSGSLNFATAENFSKKIFTLVPLNSEAKGKKGASSHNPVVSTISNEVIVGHFSKSDKSITVAGDAIGDDGKKIRWLVLDMSSLSSIDPEAAKAFLIVYKKYSADGIRVLLANCSDGVLDVLKTCRVIKEIGCDKFFPSLHDAVTCCNVDTLSSPTISIRNSSINQTLETESESELENSMYRRFENSSPDSRVAI